MKARLQIEKALWLLLASAWLFPLDWTILSSFKSSNIAIFDRPFLLEGITFADYQQAIRAGNLDDNHINSILVSRLNLKWLTVPDSTRAQPLAIPPPP